MRGLHRLGNRSASAYVGSGLTSAKRIGPRSVGSVDSTLTDKDGAMNLIQQSPNVVESGTWGVEGCRNISRVLGNHYHKSMRLVGNTPKMKQRLGLGNTDWKPVSLQLVIKDYRPGSW